MFDFIYGQGFDVYANYTLEQLRAALDRRPDARGSDTPQDDEFWTPTREPRARSFELSFADGRAPRKFIWLRRWRGMASMPVLAHEVVHHALTAFYDVGIVVNDETDEALCYYVEFLIRELLDVLNRGGATMATRKQLASKTIKRKTSRRKVARVTVGRTTRRRR